MVDLASGKGPPPSPPIPERVLPTFGKKKEGQRGKWAEARFAEFCELLNRSIFEFSAARWPDARAGSLTAAPSDFEVQAFGKHYKIEVKETTALNRLPHKNFDEGKVARMVKNCNAGAKAGVIICHINLTSQDRGWKKDVAWRTADIMHFKPPRFGGSWVFQDEHNPLMTFGEAIQTLFTDIRVREILDANNY